MFSDLPTFGFPTGQAGVGNASLTCASTLGLADTCDRVLLASTDPAPNVGQGFYTGVGNRLTKTDAVPKLDAAAAYRE